MKQHDVAIVGGGIVGLTLAALLAKNNFSVAVIESKKPELHWDKNDLTARVSAIHSASISLFHYLDCWKWLDASHCAPLETMKIWDHTNSAYLQFDSADAYETDMGFIIENRAIVSMLSHHLENNEHVAFYCPRTPKSLDTTLTLDNDETIAAQLIVGADGAHSWLRQHMTVKLQSRGYHQKAIIGVIETQHPHDNRAIQKFLTTGPVALLPLANPHHTALVWSADDEISDALMNQSTTDFSRTLTKALDHTLGDLTVISERSQFSLTMQHVDEYANDNCVLIGDAAHTIHPLAGLGVNLGLMDAACLTQILIDARDQKKSLADARVLRKYTRTRKAENNDIMVAMRALKDFFALDTTTVNLIRSLGINTIDQCVPLKKILMDVAMGKSSEPQTFLHH